MMHSRERTIAKGYGRASRTAFVIELLPVASTPWMMRLEGLWIGCC